MDEDKQDKAGVSPDGEAARRAPPTIELKASSVSESSPRADMPDNDAGGPSPEHSEPAPDAPESIAASSSSAPRAPSVLLSVLTGSVAAALVLVAATLAGWPSIPAPASTAPLTDGITANRTDIAALGTRLAKLESDAAKPAPRPAVDPALAARLDAIEKSLASLRGQSEKTAAAISEIRSASPQGAMTGEPKAAAADMSAIDERIARIERATAELGAAPSSVPKTPADDARLQRLAALVNLDKAVRSGAPYATELVAARAVAGDADALKPLDPFAQTGIPDADVLSKELLALLPQLAPNPEAQSAPSGIAERLQQSFAKLVRIQRTDALASGTTGIIARATAAARRKDVSEAKREVQQLPAAEIAPLRLWIAKVDGRDRALAASEQFTMDTLTAISKSAP